MMILVKLDSESEILSLKNNLENFNLSTRMCFFNNGQDDKFSTTDVKYSHVLYLQRMYIFLKIKNYFKINEIVFLGNWR